MATSIPTPSHHVTFDTDREEKKSEEQWWVSKFPYSCGCKYFKNNCNCTSANTITYIKEDGWMCDIPMYLHKLVCSKCDHTNTRRSPCSG